MSDIPWMQCERFEDIECFSGELFHTLVFGDCSESEDFGIDTGDLEFDADYEDGLEKEKFESRPTCISKDDLIKFTEQVLAEWKKTDDYKQFIEKHRVLDLSPMLGESIRDSLNQQKDIRLIFHVDKIEEPDEKTLQMQRDWDEHMKQVNTHPDNLNFNSDDEMKDDRPKVVVTEEEIRSLEELFRESEAGKKKYTLDELKIGMLVTKEELSEIYDVAIYFKHYNIDIGGEIIHIGNSDIKEAYEVFKSNNGVICVFYQRSEDRDCDFYE